MNLGSRPLTFEGVEAVRRVREVFGAAGFGDEGIRRATGARSVATLREVSGALLRRRIADPTPLNTMVRLFALGMTANLDAVRRAVHPMSLEEWAAAGLLTVESDRVVAPIRVLPYRGMLVAFDRPAEGEVDAEDYVMGPSDSAHTLATALVRRPAEAALDLGAGCGILGFVAASFARRVVATDFNPRAVAFARFNADLNGLPNVETLAGDLFEPVRGRRFDLVVSNPPFVISPETDLMFMNSGVSGDGFCRRIVAEVPALLAEGGYCQMLCNWAHPAGRDWRERLAGWFAGTGCDAWVMRSETTAAEDYAVRWMTLGHRTRDDAEIDRRLQQWLTCFAQLGIEAVSQGMIVMRRRDAGATGVGNWVSFGETPEKMAGPCGDEIPRGFERRDWLAARRGDDAAVMAATLRVSDHAQLDQESQPDDGEWATSAMRLRLAQGFTYAAQVDPFVARLVAACDGRRSLGEVADELAVAMGRPADEVRAAAAGVARAMVERGFVTPLG